MRSGKKLKINFYFDSSVHLSEQFVRPGEQYASNQYLLTWHISQRLTTKIANNTIRVPVFAFPIFQRNSILRNRESRSEQLDVFCLGIQYALDKRLIHAWVNWCKHQDN